MITVTRKLTADYGHRVLRHESKCKHLHGHLAVIEVTVEAPELDDLGRVVDFGCLKQILGGWVDANWDHNILLNKKDPLQVMYQNMGDREIGLADAETGQVMGCIDPVFGGKAPYVMKYGNPTAENMAREFCEVAQALLPAPLRVMKVRVYETPNCWADYEPPRV